MRNTIWLWALRLLQTRCEHPNYAVIADIDEGEQEDHKTEWCAICGAYRFVFFRITGIGMGNWFGNAWEHPRPDWYTPRERKELHGALAESK